jgi:hypothetical protein
MLLESKKTIYEEYEHLASEAFKAKPELVLYGFSVDAHRILSALVFLGFTIKAIIDKKNLNCQDYMGILIIQVEELEDKNSVIIVCTNIRIFRL